MGNYTVNMLNQAGWLVYINGLEIPVSSLSVQYGVWAPPTLTLDMVPHTMLTRIGAEDRLQVVVFYLDHHWDPGNPEFCLLGEFEVVGWSYNNTPRGRFMSLSCVSQLQIFQQLHFYYISSLDDIATASSPIENTDNTAKIVKVFYPASLFLDGLTSPIKVASGKDDPGAESTIDTNPFIKRPIDFVLNIFSSILRPISSESPVDDNGHPIAGAVAANSREIPQTSASLPSKNFFARWFKMTQFHQRWGALPYIEDDGEDGCFGIIKAAQDTVTLPVLQQQIGQGVGNAGSAWELLQKVLGYMYMEIIAIPAPPAATTTKGYAVIQRRKDSDLNKGDTVFSIPTYFVKPMCTFALPPACNVVFPSMMLNYSFQENYITQPTRLYLSEQFMSEVIHPPESSSQTNMVKELMVTGYPEALRKRMKDMMWDSPETSNKNFLLFEEEFFKGPVTKRMNAPPWMYLLEKQENAYQKGLTEDQKADDDSVRTELGKPLGALFDMYAKYEYYRSRFVERSGGINMLWNPYIVPGFPVMAFDQRSAGFDTMGYANDVSHRMSAAGGGSMTTTVGMTFVRTMPEFLGLIGEETEDVDISPPEVIPEVRKYFQKVGPAHDFYKRLLYRDDPMKKAAVFDWKQMLDAKNSKGEIVDLDKNTWQTDPTVKLHPKSEFDGLFEGYDAAMQYASRPACTLREYITTWHGRSINGLLQSETIKGEYTSFYSPTNDAKKTKGAIFWGRIYKLVQGPGSDPGVKYSNVGKSPEYESAGDSGWEPGDTSRGIKQTRQDWDKILEEYRKIVRSEAGNIAPQS